MIRLINRAFCCLCGLGLMVACTDTWNDHYAENSTTGEGTLWQAIEQNQELSNFARVAQAAGYDTRLGSSQVFTVFAPVNANFSSEEADRLINLYQTEKQNGVRDDDNQVITQFLQNHIALFNYSVSSLSDDSITMMNGKYEVLTGSTFGHTNLITSNQYVSNGVLFTVDRPEQYFPNVYEYLRQDGEMDSLYNFLSSYNVYEFDAEESVPGDIVDGKTVFLDSVFHLNNAMLRTYGYINREDSNYLALVPTDDVWAKLYDSYKGYFNYNDLTNKRDSMVRTHIRRSIADGIFFNLNEQKSIQDSALSTTYQTLYRNQPNYADPRYYFYRRPYDTGGAFSWTEAVACSNGQVLKARQWNIDKLETFLQQIKVEAEQSRYVDTIIQAHEPLSIRTVPTTNPFYGHVSGNTFVEAQPLSSVSSTSVRYLIPDQLSNVGYDIYAVFVPAIAYDENASKEDRLPCRVRFWVSYQEQDGTVKTVSLRNPKDNAVNFTTTADVVDSVLVASDYHFPTCALDIDDPQVTLRVASNLTSSMSSRYTRTLRLDCIILRPHQD